MRPSHVDSLWQFLLSRLKMQRLDFAAAALDDALEQGNALVLLDGLDEIPIRGPAAVRPDAIETFAQRYDPSRMIATCRTLSYSESEWHLLVPSSRTGTLRPGADRPVRRPHGMPSWSASAW